MNNLTIFDQLHFNEILHDPTYLKTITPSLPLQRAVIKEDFNLLRHITNPCKETHLEAVKQNGSAIAYIKNPDKDVQLAAITQTIEAMHYIRYPHPDVLVIYEQRNFLDLYYQLKKQWV